MPAQMPAGEITGCTPEETATLINLGHNAEDFVTLNATAASMQLMQRGLDPRTGAAVELYAIVVMLPEGFIRPPSVLLDQNGRPASGGLQAVVPLPPTVRMLLNLDTLPLAVRTQIRAARDAQPVPANSSDGYGEES